MMKNRHLLSGIPVVLLAFVLVFSACENGTTEVEGTVGISSQEAPVVTAKAVKGGVLLEWNPILGASYNVWRKAGNAEAIQLSYSGDYVYQDKETGKYRYLDLVSDTNALTANTEYTYTVVATGNSQTIGKTEVKATPTDIPAKGAKLDPVSAVTLTLSPDTETISVSWTAAAVPAQYYVSVYRDGSLMTNNNSSINTSLGETKASFNWSSAIQTEGEYAASVYAYVPSSNNSPYYKNSDPVASAGQKYEALFGSSGTSASGPTQITDGNTLTGFSVSITISTKPGVTYAVERAPVDAAGNAGAYTAATLYKDSSATTVLPPAELTANATGLPTIYDKLPATPGKYKYRVKATKGSVTQTKEISSPITVDPRNQASGSISIGTATGSDPKTYAVTPSLTYKGALQTGDKLVIYYVKGKNSSVASPYTQGVEFSKAELEAATVVAKNLEIPKAAGDTYAYVKAYLVFADGSGKAPQSVTSSISTSGGVSSNNGTYATLNY